MQSPRDREVVGIHHAGDPEALHEHVASLLEQFDKYYEFGRPNLEDYSIEFSDDATFGIDAQFCGHWTFCMLIWSAFVGSAQVSQDGADDWLRRCRNV